MGSTGETIVDSPGAVAVTEALSTLVWPSAIVGLPAGVLAGVVGFGVTYYLLSR